MNGQPVLRDIRLEVKATAALDAAIADVCRQLAEVRLTKGGKKTYHLMVACYFWDLARVWLALRRVCDSPSDVCFVIGDSAPYGVYVPVIDWLGRLAVAAGFFELLGRGLDTEDAAKRVSLHRSAYIELYPFRRRPSRPPPPGPAGSLWPRSQRRC